MQIVSQNSKTIPFSQTEWEGYATLLEYLNHQYAKMKGNFFVWDDSDDIKDLKNYLESD